MGNFFTRSIRKKYVAEKSRIFYVWLKFRQAVLCGYYRLTDELITMPTEQDILGRLQAMTAEHIRTAFTSTGINFANEDDLTGLWLQFLASDAANALKLTVVQNIFKLEAVSTDLLHIIMATVLKFHWLKIPFEFEYDHSTRRWFVTVTAHSHTERAKVVPLCELAIYLAQQKFLSPQILESLLYAVFGHSMGIDLSTKERNIAKQCIQNLDLSNVLYAINHVFIRLFGDSPVDLLQSTSLKNLFDTVNAIAHNSSVHQTERAQSNIYRAIGTKIVNDEIFFFVDREERSINYTHQNISYTVNLACEETFSQLCQFYRVRMFQQSATRPHVFSKELMELLQIVANGSNNNEIIMQAVEKIKELSDEKLSLLLERLHEFKEVKKLIKYVKRTKKQDITSTSKVKLSFFNSLENYQRKHQKRSLRLEAMQRDLIKDYSQISLAPTLQEIIDECLAVDGLQKRKFDEVLKGISLRLKNSLPNDKSTAEDTEQQKMAKQYNEEIKEKISALVTKLLQQSFADLLILVDRLFIYPEIMKLIKTVYLTNIGRAQIRKDLLSSSNEKLLKYARELPENKQLLMDTLQLRNQLSSLSNEQFLKLANGQTDYFMKQIAMDMYTAKQEQEVCALANEGSSTGCRGCEYSPT